MAENRELQILITAKDETSKKLDGINGKLKDLEPSFKKMATAGSVALGAITAFAVKGISDFGEAEKSAKQLEYAVINVSHATQEQLKQTEALADALEKKGVLDGDGIRMGLAQLSTFGLSNQAVQGLASSLSDLAVNQFGVNASGEQLADTANMIAKALNGQFGVLEKSGIRFTEAQKAIIATGTELEKVKAINEGFQQNLKYTNDVALTTFEGQLAKVKVQLGNVSESIGQALLPIIQNLLTTITPVIQKMLDWATQNPDLIQKIILIGGALAGVVAVVGFLGLVLPSIITGFTILGSILAFLISPIGLIVVSIGALIAVGVMLYKHWDEVSAFAKRIWDGIVSFFQGVWETIKNIFNFAVALILGIVITAFDAMGIDIIAVVETIKTALSTAWAFLSELFIKITQAITKGFEFIKAIFKTATKPLTDAWKSLWDSIGGTVVGVWEGIKNTIKNSINWIIEKINGFIKRVNDIAKAGNVIPGVSIPQIPSIPLLAKGGIVNSPTLAMIGEAGPEAVVPLDKGGFGGGINIYISGNTVVGRNGMDEFVRMIGDNLSRQLNLNGVGL